MKSRVHPKYKTKYRVGNWAEYDRALVRRGDVTIWLSPEAIPRVGDQPTPAAQEGEEHGDGGGREGGRGPHEAQFTENIKLPGGATCREDNGNSSLVDRHATRVPEVVRQVARGQLGPIFDT